ncbi:dicarboxylate/amino acid:cation symporter [uncultured Adlercreutzia sp.]|uniref:dicarboxylate/amino acid:cation symporter n=1 Tax=uncultured Adlercreutzia sp. TaxID=875803 RepID=UPI002674A230|nr:dicarboxylate/amino acid:cation symporter [uncultured Adlercreutzia sp.]
MEFTNHLQPAEEPDELGKGPRRRPRLGLTSQILLALVLGLLCGVALHYVVPAGAVRDDILVGGVFYLVGQGFIRLMQMLVVPLVFCSIVCGAAAIDTKTLGSVGVKTLLLYLLTTAVAITLALAVGNLINPGEGVDMSALGTPAPDAAPLDEAAETNTADTLLGIIPSNPVAALASGDMLPLIFFALFVGIVLARLGRRVETVHSFFVQFNDIMMEMTSLVMKVAPLGVFCLLARTFANVGFEAFVPMLKYMGGVVLALALQLGVTYMVLLWVFARMSPLMFLRKFFSVAAFGFSTATSNATIPLNIETLEKKMGVDRRISSFTIPLGATINMDGTAIMQGVAVVFTAQLFGVPLGPAEYATVIATATLASIGTAGVPSVGLITLSMVFNAVGLPLEGVALIMGIDRILDMCRTAVNITGDAVVTSIVAAQAGRVDRAVFRDPDAGSEVDDVRLSVRQ